MHIHNSFGRSVARLDLIGCKDKSVKLNFVQSLHYSSLYYRYEIFLGDFGFIFEDAY